MRRCDWQRGPTSRCRMLSTRLGKRVREELVEYLDKGADEILVQPVPVSRGGDPERTIRAVGEVFR
jgi:hypothetical protein